MTDKPVSPLRQRMIEDMTVRHFKEKVQKDYIRHVQEIAAQVVSERLPAPNGGIEHQVNRLNGPTWFGI